MPGLGLCGGVCAGDGVCTVRDGVSDAAGLAIESRRPVAESPADVALSARRCADRRGRPGENWLSSPRASASRYSRLNLGVVGVTGARDRWRACATAGTCGDPGARSGPRAMNTRGSSPSGAIPRAVAIDRLLGGAEDGDDSEDRDDGDAPAAAAGDLETPDDLAGDFEPPVRAGDSEPLAPEADFADFADGTPPRVVRGVICGWPVRPLSLSLARLASDPTARAPGAPGLASARSRRLSSAYMREGGGAVGVVAAFPPSSPPSSSASRSPETSQCRNSFMSPSSDPLRRRRRESETASVAEER
jgi:hypothetical protein